MTVSLILIANVITVEGRLTYRFLDIVGGQSRRICRHIYCRCRAYREERRSTAGSAACIEPAVGQLATNCTQVFLYAVLYAYRSPLLYCLTLAPRCSQLVRRTGVGITSTLARVCQYPLPYCTNFVVPAGDRATCRCKSLHHWRGFRAVTPRQFTPIETAGQCKILPPKKQIWTVVRSTHRRSACSNH